MLHRRTVGDVMTEEVVTLRPDTPYSEITPLLDANDIAAAPVVDDEGAPVGVVSASDLLRHETGLPSPQGGDGDDEDLAWAKARARTAGALMSSPVFVARADWSIPQAARELRLHRVKQLPVVDEHGLLTGIVSRTDLLGVFFRPDADIRAEIEQEVLGRLLELGGHGITTEVHDGAVTLSGRVPEERLIAVVEGLCQGVDGVVDVHARLEPGTGGGSARS